MEKIYGPYTRKDGRKHLIVYPTGDAKKPFVRYTISYPKWLMGQHIGRKLESWETVDHINRDFTDDRIENLQILGRVKHSKLDAKRVKFVEIVCVWCGNKAFKQPNYLRGNSKQGKAGPFCSRVCVGYYGKSVELGGPKLTTQPRVTSEYYYMEK